MADWSFGETLLVAHTVGEAGLACADLGVADLVDRALDAAGRTLP